MWGVRRCRNCRSWWQAGGRGAVSGCRAWKRWAPSTNFSAYVRKRPGGYPGPKGKHAMHARIPQDVSAWRYLFHAARERQTKTERGTSGRPDLQEDGRDNGKKESNTSPGWAQGRGGTEEEQLRKFDERLEGHRGGCGDA